jgi:fructose-bisphosphate aldolase, class I
MSRRHCKRLLTARTPKEPAMTVTPRVKAILANYESDNPGTKSNLARILTAGKLGGTGKLVILPVDQGFEHGPARSFAANPAGYEPHYHWNLAVSAGLSAFAAPLGMIEDGASSFAGQIPTILKLNSANSLMGEKDAPTQAITGSVNDAVRLGCSAVGYTIYPGSGAAYDMMNDLREITAEAKAKGLAVVVWSYPRGKYVTKDGELALDVIAYGAHMAALMGAHIIKVKLPTDHLDQGEAKKVYETQNIPRGTLAQRVANVVQSCFGGRRIVVFSGGAAKSEDSIFEDAKAIRDGGGNGSIIGRNSFQRPYDQAITLLNKLTEIYQGK